MAWQRVVTGTGTIDKNVFKYTWRHTKPQQVWILIVVLASMVPLFMSLDLPRQIINGPIQGSGYEEPGALLTYFQFEIPVPGWISETGAIPLTPGIDLDRMTALFMLSGIFLGFVIITKVARRFSAAATRENQSREQQPDYRGQKIQLQNVPGRSHNPCNS